MKITSFLIVLWGILVYNENKHLHNKCLLNILQLYMKLGNLLFSHYYAINIIVIILAISGLIYEAVGK